MALTLIEAAKLAQTPLQAGVIETIAKNSGVLERLPFLPVSSNAYTYNQEQTLPGVAFRAVGENYTESTGVINPVTERLSILGGVSDYDRALVKTQGNVNNLRAVHDAMKAKSESLKFTATFFKGDSEADPKAFDGLQKRLTGGQVINQGSTSGGDALTLAKLDEMLDAVVGGADALFLNKRLRRKVSDLVRAAGQSTEVVSDAFGRQLTAYAGIPMVAIEADETGTDILGFTEANPGGGTAASSSIYAVRFGAGEFVSGLECGGVDVIDMGLYSGGTAYRTLIEWITGMAVFHPKAAARLRGIKNA
ncbi:hypothetical protein ASZ90_000096 [hydrocarbon metagenome]|uniref:Phage major capsid protein n=1 Tax=hydrocarbon metagenome TaxID=938273 RepID=A0A0W8GAE6_9ZZZZ